MSKSLFTWKTAGILTGMKLATLAVVIGLARAGLLPQWFPHLGLARFGGQPISFCHVGAQS